MKIHRLYADKNGESHFQDVEVEYAEPSRDGRLSKRIRATGIIFREVQPDYDLDWHPAPRRQYIINLDAGVQITASDCFFFQAEDGIRDLTVTGVQTCALP